ncbi:MAG: hypothetical protein ACOY0S_04500 [Patescibacteria group bacterium]
MPEVDTTTPEVKAAPEKEEPKTEASKPAEKAQLTRPVSRLVNRYVESLTALKGAATPIHVDDIASRVAKFYELIRKVVDWKEDNLLRRTAIERILKRLLFSRLSGLTLAGHPDAHRVAETLTLDLIRGGHLPNDEIPQEKIEVVTNILKKYLYFLEHTQFTSSDPLIVKRRINYFTFLLELAACEIEEVLVEPILVDGLLIAMTESLLERIHVKPAEAMTNDEKFVQAYIATARALFDLEDSFITYRLLAFQYAEWKNPAPAFIQRMNTDLPSIWEQLPSILEHPLAKQFYNLAEQFDTVFALLGDVLDSQKANPKELPVFLTNKKEFLQEIERFYDKRFSSLKKRLLNLGIFSTLSVFASNWTTFFLVEVPLANVFAEGFNFWTALTDFVVPTAVMFFLVMIIRPPKPENKKRVIEAVESFNYLGHPIRYYDVRAVRPRRPIMNFMIGIFYLTMITAVLGAVAWVFWFARLPITSVIFDTFTIALTVFAAVTIRNKSKELTVGERTSLVEFFLDMISVPVAKLGSFLAAKWKEYNIIAFFFTFLIETPFTKVVDVIESWSQFLKERRAELH